VDQGQGVAGDKLRDYLAKDTEKPV
jgi:hypothetical protein